MAAPWQARHGLTSQQYQAAFDQLVAAGYRLTDVNGYGVEGTALFAAIWEKTSGPAWQARHDLTSAQYQTTFNTLTAQGYRPIRVSGYTIGGQDRYAAIFVQQPNAPAWQARHGLTSAQYQTEFDALVKQGYRLVDVSGYTIDKTPRFAAIWEKTTGPAWQARHGLTSAQYQSVFNELTAQGYRPVRVNGYTVDDQDRYTAIFVQQGGRAWAARHDLTSTQYQGVFDNLLHQGYRLKDVSGYEEAGHAKYAGIWESESMLDVDLALIDQRIKAYMTQHDVPGLSIAITRNERLVYAEGFGNADTAAGERVDPRHRFRVASVSKPVTGIAVMRLVQAGSLTLDQKVFGAGAILGTTYGTQPYGERVKQVTVRHLLQHTSGFTNTGGDPMFFNGAMTQAQIISWMLDNRPPVNPPGQTYEYSNFGYCVLGRVIEKVTGQTYENWVKANVLAPCGITRMEIGGSTLVERKPKEVVYYGGSPYALLPRRMDAHGGWIATPIDLVRLMARTDGFTAKTDILTGANTTTMSTGSTANPGYALGWGVDATSRSHNGAMDGTIALLVRRNDGYSYAVAANTRPASDPWVGNLRAVLDGIVKDVTAWPTYDLF